MGLFCKKNLLDFKLARSTAPAPPCRISRPAAPDLPLRAAALRCLSSAGRPWARLPGPEPARPESGAGTGRPGSGPGSAMRIRERGARACGALRRRRRCRGCQCTRTVSARAREPQGPREGTGEPRAEVVHVAVRGVRVALRARERGRVGGRGGEGAARTQVSAAVGGRGWGRLIPPLDSRLWPVTAAGRGW